MERRELAVFDLLTQPDPVLTDEERETVKSSAKSLLAHLHQKLVQDWRRDQRRHQHHQASAR